MMEFCDRDPAVGLWKTGNSNIDKIIVVYVYMDILLPGVWPAAFKRLLDFCERRKKEVLICGDTEHITPGPAMQSITLQGHLVEQGGGETKERGKSLFFLFPQELH